MTLFPAIMMPPMPRPGEQRRWFHNEISTRGGDLDRAVWMRSCASNTTSECQLHNYCTSDEQDLHMCNCSSNVQTLQQNCTSSANPLYTLKHFITRPLISSSCPLCNDARHLSAGHYFTAKSHWTQLQLCEYGVTISEFKNTILQDIAVHTSACTGVNNGDC